MISPIVHSTQVQPISQVADILPILKPFTQQYDQLTDVETKCKMFPPVGQVVLHLLYSGRVPILNTGGHKSNMCQDLLNRGIWIY